MKVAITCIQLLRDIEDWRSRFADAGLDLVLPAVSGQQLEGDQLVATLEGCVGVVAGDDQFTRAVMERLPELRSIAKWGIGVDGIDRVAAADLGITVTNTPGMFDDEVADVTMAYVTILARHLVIIDRHVRSGTWHKPAGTSLRGSTLGIVGLGGIGRATARRALVAGMRVVGSDPSPDSCALATELGAEPMPFESVLAEADFIAVTAPLTPTTHHLLDDAAFASCRPQTRLINTGRGAVVDSDALVRALRNGTISAAALDVMEIEPLAATSELAGFDQVVFGSHNASNTLQASARVHARAIDNLIASLGVTS